MLRTFHIQNLTQQGVEVKQLNVSEFLNGKKVIIGIADGDRYAEMELNHQQFQELCDLRYTVDLTDVEVEPQEQIEVTQLSVLAA